MEKIFEQAKDLHVVATYVYGNGTDTIAYVDAECETQFTASELKEVFIKGAMIVIGDALHKAVSFENDTIYYVDTVTVEDVSSVAIVGLAGASEEEAE